MKMCTGLDRRFRSCKVKQVVVQSMASVCQDDTLLFLHRFLQMIHSRLFCPIFLCSTFTLTDTLETQSLERKISSLDEPGKEGKDFERLGRQWHISPSRLLTRSYDTFYLQLFIPLPAKFVCHLSTQMSGSKGSEERVVGWERRE